jgi:hypothetical protein
MRFKSPMIAINERIMVSSLSVLNVKDIRKAESQLPGLHFSVTTVEPSAVFGLFTVWVVKTHCR